MISYLFKYSCNAYKKMNINLFKRELYELFSLIGHILKCAIFLGSTLNIHREVKLIIKIGFWFSLKYIFLLLTFDWELSNLMRLLNFFWIWDSFSSILFTASLQFYITIMSAKYGLMTSKCSCFLILLNKYSSLKSIYFKQMALQFYLWECRQLY